ncbi:Hypothetical protein CAP_5527 [Chondromyces apiculatus DSM 436]|uniref:Uncharacterized protein n=1 Tax=Chondromyces apiculatus DSM 436 TaxID=1192034 RepID=A0A017T2W0_9BACT|nr:Hypothetical protein CAP_5527 [Chondromyces apiculatus DSM 436]
MEVCAEDRERSGEVARGCAQSGAPGPVQACTCSGAGAEGSCEVGRCEMTEE